MKTGDSYLIDDIELNNIRFAFKDYLKNTDVIKGLCCRNKQKFLIQKRHKNSKYIIQSYCILSTIRYKFIRTKIVLTEKFIKELYF